MQIIVLLKNQNWKKKIIKMSNNKNKCRKKTNLLLWMLVLGEEKMGLDIIKKFLL